MTVIVQPVEQNVTVTQERPLTTLVQDLTAPGSVIINPAAFTVAKMAQDIVMQQITPAWSIVTWTGYIADSSNTNHIGRIAGITIAACEKDVSTSVIVIGPVTNTSWTWNPGDELYLNGSGNLSTTAPTSGFVQKIATAKSANIIELLFSPPVRY